MSTLRNQVRLTGHLGSDPEMKTFGENRNFARVSLATNERYRNMDGEWVSETNWHQLVYWGKSALFAKKNLSKGQEICVEGKLVNRSFVDKDGNPRNVTEVVVNDTLIVARRNGGGNEHMEEQGEDQNGDANVNQESSVSDDSEA